MLETVWIFAVGLIPPLFSLWMMRRSEVKTQARLRQAMNARYRVRTPERYNTPEASDRYYLDSVGYLIGDISCRFNARSGYLRCAVNPLGPCQGCRYYQEVESRR